jgi:sugar (glycoside-pentoside-hexuronide) transporter
MKKDVSMGQRLSYAGAAFGQNIIYTFTASYLMFFYTDILGISAAAAGLLFLATRTFDACNDPLMGFLADRTKTRFGKFRPYLMASPPFIALVTILCFIAPSGPHLLVYAFITYFLWGIAYTACDIPLWAIPSVLSRDQDQKTSAVAWSKIGGLCGQVSIVVGGILLLEFFGGQWEASAYVKTAMTLTIPGAALIMLSGVFLREHVKHEKVAPFKAGFMTLLRNKRIFPLMLSFFLFNLTLGLRAGMQLYYATYVLGDASLMVFIGGAIVIGMAGGMIAAPFAIKRFGSLFLFNLSCIASGLTSLVPQFTGYENLVQLLIWIAISFVFMGVANITWPALLLDTIADSEKRTGLPLEGIFFSAQTFVLKLIASVSAGIAGISLTMLGYVERAVQTQRVIDGLHTLMFAFPAVLFLLAPLPMLLYQRAVKNSDGETL